MDAQSLFELSREPANLLGNLRRLIDQGHSHAPDGVGIELHEFGGGHDKRQVIVHIVPHGGEFPSQLFHLLGTERDGLVWQ